MLKSIINYSIRNKLIIILFVLSWIGLGVYSLLNISIGAVPDITNNQVQVITTSRNLATEEVEKFLTYPVELEMANLPGVKEIRSISKFGLSVVTIVFEDHMGTYLPRQLIAEKIKNAEATIPEGFGSPFMGPVSTGLGEIYQYILDVEPGYEDQYDVEDLRTIQDWIVKRQLSGIPGVVEVNTWGGHLKTYEVAVDPTRLKSLDIIIGDVYEALQSNNSVSGGGYIEKANQSYFVRADGLIDNLSEIEQIVVDNRNGVPIYIKDVAKVGFGKATRFGAITGNGEGEKVLGQVMMLKGASSNDVIQRVKARVKEVQKTLPEGVFINPFLERSELIGRTTSTIIENLLLGSLIVVFVVILLLGNIRSGLIVASVIPLSLLFALTLMHIFGIDANLMSLGAIDFGIIIDGAVIIVEYVTFRFAQRSSELVGLTRRELRNKRDAITLDGTQKMMHSAVFGQVIIILVFIPILSLVGVEGKMFRPMALTFSFALIGAMLLCFTYVPVMASLFLKPVNPKKLSYTRKLMLGLQGIYRPIIRWALSFRYVVLGLAVLLLLLSAVLFSRMGGEFIPTLDEGDFVIQPVLKTGMSLDQTVKLITRMEKIIKRFPETKQVVTRIGAAEVPTDPMSMEESDVIITLQPKKNWTSADSKDDLAALFKTAIEDEIPNVEIEFTQPIEMRFNELITGVRADLAIKIFGEDLEILQQKANEIGQKIEAVDGAADIIVDKTEGLPQMMVKYRRDQIARFGLSISGLNDIISMGFAGKTAGVIFEGERQFDLVVKYEKDRRDELVDLQNAQVEVPGVGQMPMSAFADIYYDSGPAKISRDDTRRRVVVGVNVRGRDLQSVVDDVQEIIQKEIRFPSGYEVQYGGQFENLQSASNRLLYAVPIALILIFIMLFFAFHSIRDTIIVFTAIPLASVGGIILLYLRGMPFSISAGVGFIALFGIAVLNGIVLIEHFKTLRKDKDDDINKIIVQGATERLRPVLLTASAAALGFLPMAISNSAGAEVQRPLATVVIGGLVSATLLTLLVLPVLYAMFSRPRSKNISLPLVLILSSMFSVQSFAQEKFTIDDALTMAYENNLILKNAQLEIQKASTEIGLASFTPNTSFFYGHDRANLGENNLALHVIGGQQSIPSPSVNRSHRIYRESRLQTANQALAVERLKLSEQVYQAYNEMHYFHALKAEMLILDSLYTSFITKAEQRHDLGESTYLELLTATSKAREIHLELEKTEQQYTLAKAKLYRVVQSGIPEEISFDTYGKWSLKTDAVISHPLIDLEKQKIADARALTSVSESAMKPEYSISLFYGLAGTNNFNGYPGIETGISLPLNRKSYKAEQQANRIQMDIQQAAVEYLTADLTAKKAVIQEELSLYEEALNQFEDSGRQLARELLSTARRSFNLGEIDFFRFVQISEHAIELKLVFLQNLMHYNAAVIKFNHLSN